MPVRGMRDYSSPRVGIDTNKFAYYALSRRGAPRFTNGHTPMVSGARHLLARCRNCIEGVVDVLVGQAGLGASMGRFPAQPRLHDGRTPFRPVRALEVVLDHGLSGRLRGSHALPTNPYTSRTR
jgi:hypothetical protein